MIGPGDELVVKLWGRMEGTYRLRVDRDGKVFVPKMGPLSVAGKTLGEVKTLLRNRFGTIAEVSSDVSIGQMKGFIVSVLGEVQSPGRYQVSSFHTALQAIAIAGGIKDIGSLRRVQVRRGKETAKEIDIYDFLLRGDVTHDIRLSPGDAVFVPVVGPLVAVAGEVRRPAIYELKGERAIREVVETAGGLAPSAYKRRVQVERLEGNRARVAIDLNLEEAEPALSSFRLQDGDILRILAVLPEMENVVEVEGNVQRPGKYEWKPGLTVASLVPDEKFFLPDTFLDYALVTRLVGPERRKVILPVNLRKIIVERDAASDVALQPMDTLTVYNVSSFREKMIATVAGEVRNPGSYEIFPGTRVSDLVKLGGDLTRNASLEEAEIARLTEDKKNTTILVIDLRRALAGDPAQNLLIQDQDQLMVRPMPDLQEQRDITLAGEIRSPGVYAARKGERLSSILKRAGGFTKDAFLRGAIFTRALRAEAPAGADRPDHRSVGAGGRADLDEGNRRRPRQGRHGDAETGPGDAQASPGPAEDGAGAGTDHRPAFGARQAGGNRERPRRRAGGPAGGAEDTPGGQRAGARVQPHGRRVQPVRLDGGVLPAESRRTHGGRRPRPHLRGAGGRHRSDEGHDRPGVLDNGRRRPDVRKARGGGRHRGPGEAGVLPRDEGREGHHPDHDAARGHARGVSGDSLISMSAVPGQKYSGEGGFVEERQQPDYTDDEIDLGEYFAVFRKVWWKIVLLSLAVGLVTLLVMFRIAEHLPGDRGHHPLNR